MKYISICSGIEAATVAFHGFGWTPLAFSEIEAFPSAVLAARWPQVPNLGDMTKFAEWPEEILAECDLLVGGPPCQAFSVAGLRKSLDDDRGNITLAYVRLLNHIDEVRKRHGRPPAIALYENVPGLLSTKDSAFGCLVGALAGCDEAPKTETGKWPKAGYVCGETRRVGYRVLDAQFFGVAQRRRRIFLVAVPGELVASLGDGACPSEILSLRESVRGNPPSRSKAGQGAAASAEGRPRGGGEPCYLDRAMFNQGVNAQYEPQVTQDGVAGSMVARGPAAVGVSGSCGTAVASVYPCLDANVDAKWGSNQWVDGGFPILEAFGGNNTSGPIDAAAALLSHGGSVGRLNFTSETFAVVPEVANPLTHRMHKGMNTTVDEGQTPIVTTGDAVCFKPSHFTRGKDGKPSDVTPPLSADADKGDQDTVVAHAMRESGQGFWMKDEIAGTLRAEGENRPSRPSNVIAQPTSAVGFNWQNGGGYGKANDGLGITEEGTGPLQRCNTPAVAYGLRGDAGREGVAKTPSADAEGVAKTPSADAEGRVRLRNPSFNPLEELSPTMDASQPHAVAFANRTRDVVKMPEIMKDGVVPSLTNLGGGGRSDAVNVCLPTPLQEVSKRTGKSTDDPRAGIGSAGDPMYTLQAGARHGCHAAMQVRRLTPNECEFLQGFPAGHTDIVFRKKPAADGPRYKALGNSMAVPCMFWIGHRIHQATKGDNA